MRLFRQASTIDADGQHAGEQQHRDGNGPQQSRRQVQRGGRGGQVAERRQGRQRRQRAAQGQAGEQRHVGDIRGPQAMTRIQTVANRAARQQ